MTAILPERFIALPFSGLVVIVCATCSNIKKLFFFHTFIYIYIYISNGCHNKWLSIPYTTLIYVKLHCIEEYAFTTVDYSKINEVIHFISCTDVMQRAVFEGNDRVLD